MNRAGLRRTMRLSHFGHYLIGEHHSEWEWPLIKGCLLWVLLWMMTAAT